MSFRISVARWKKRKIPSDSKSEVFPSSFRRFLSVHWFHADFAGTVGTATNPLRAYPTLSIVLSVPENTPFLQCICGWTPHQRQGVNHLILIRMKTTLEIETRAVLSIVEELPLAGERGVENIGEKVDVLERRS